MRKFDIRIQLPVINITGIIDKNMNLRIYNFISVITNNNFTAEIIYFIYISYEFA